MKTRAALALLCALGLVPVACGGGDSPGEETPTPAASVPTTTASPSPTATTAPTATPTLTPTPGASPTNPLPAALADLDAVSGSDCDAPANADKYCVTLTSNEETIRNGIAAFGVASRAGGGFVAIYGRNQAGDWLPWLQTQNTFLLLFLPGDVRVCADGDGLNVRELPTISGTVIETIPDETTARVDQFVLDTPGTGDSRGFGWYRVTTPVEGWAHSDFLAAAALGDCFVRNAQVTPAVPPPTPAP